MAKRQKKDTEKAESFGETIRHLRREKDLTQAQVAEATGVSRNYIVMMEKGTSPPPSDECIRRLEKALGVPRNHLRDIGHFERAPKDLRSKLTSLEKSLAQERAAKEEYLTAFLTYILGRFVMPSGLGRRLREIFSKNPAAVKAFDALMAHWKEGQRARPEEVRSLLEAAGPEEREAFIAAFPRFFEKRIPARELKEHSRALLGAIKELEGEESQKEAVETLRQRVEARRTSTVSPREVVLLRIPLISRTAAGDPRNYTDADYPTGWAEEFVAAPEDVTDRSAFALRIEGDSMVPRFSHGDVVIVSPDTPLKEGACVVAKTKGEEVTCKVYRTREEKIVLESINAAYPTLELEKDDVLWMYPVVKSIRDETK
jgi:SOS-response transcriptional repressor LexA/DNA-binding XRE family transcriptional regulator